VMSLEVESHPAKGGRCDCSVIEGSVVAVVVRPAFYKPRAASDRRNRRP